MRLYTYKLILIKNSFIYLLRFSLYIIHIIIIIITHASMVYNQYTL